MAAFGPNQLNVTGPVTIDKYSATSESFVAASLPVRDSPPVIASYLATDERAINRSGAEGERNGARRQRRRHFGRSRTRLIPSLCPATAVTEH
jgi:hypothetical protein